MEVRFVGLQRESGGSATAVTINPMFVRMVEDVTVEGGPARTCISFSADDKVVVNGTVEYVTTVLTGPTRD